MFPILKTDSFYLWFLYKSDSCISCFRNYKEKFHNMLRHQPRAAQCSIVTNVVLDKCFRSIYNHSGILERTRISKGMGVTPETMEGVALSFTIVDTVIRLREGVSSFSKLSEEV